MPVTQATSALRVVALLLLCVLSSAAFAAVPTVTSMFPNSGTITGGQTVTITGTGFTAPNVTAVTFGGTAGTNVVVISATQLQVTTPAKAVGVYTVLVNNGSSSVANPPGSNYTFTNANTTLQVTVRITIPKRADIQWGAATTADDTPAARASTILNYLWVVKDAALGNFADVGTTYLNNDATNNKTLTISNISKTGSTVNIAAIASDTVNWTNTGSIVTADQFRVRAQLSGAGNTQQVVATTVAVNLTNATPISIGADQTLVLEITTPPSISAASAAVPQNSTVTLTATAN